MRVGLCAGVVMVLALALSSSAWACKCKISGSWEETSAKAPVVVHARATGFDEVDDRRDILFEVIDVKKGDVNVESFRIKGGSGKDCRRHAGKFVVGFEYEIAMGQPSDEGQFLTTCEENVLRIVVKDPPAVDPATTSPAEEEKTGEGAGDPEATPPQVSSGSKCQVSSLSSCHTPVSGVLLMLLMLGIALRSSPILPGN